MLKDKVCLVTGALHGMGKQIAVDFAKQGAVVFGNILPGSDEAAWRSDFPKEVHDSIFPSVFDVTDTAAVKAAIIAIKKQFGRIDVLVNNAGVAYNERIGMISADKVEEMFRINVFAVIEITQLVARIMMRQNAGSIINISSMVGVKGDKFQTAYAASKGAVIAMTKSAAKELAPAGIRVNSIAPGLTDTPMFHETKEEKLQERLRHIGMGRIATTRDVAGACLFLASDLSEYITGQIIGVDGSAII